MRTGMFSDLIGIAIAPPCPLEGQRGENARHRVIGMRCHSTLASKCEYDLRTKLPNQQSQIADNSVQILPVQLAIGIVEHNAAADFQISHDAANSLRRMAASS